MRKRNSDYVTRNTDIYEALMRSPAMLHSFMTQCTMKGERSFAQALTPYVGQNCEGQFASIDHRCVVSFSKPEPRVKKHLKVH
jgi:hypothetical protein